jgi:RimJ/RimL family protein N-acetyltransferase
MPNIALSSPAEKVPGFAASARSPNWPPHLLHLRDGAITTVEFVTMQDGAELQDYFLSLSSRARYNRFAGATSGLSNRELDQLVKIGDNGRYAVVVRRADRDGSPIVGEARYALDRSARTLEFAVSVSEAFRGRGLGLALLFNLECRGRILGATTMFGDTLRTNGEMQGLARKAGFSFAATPGDWREIRLVKAVGGCCHEWEREWGDGAASQGTDHRSAALA